MIAIACAGVIGLGVAASPVMAAAPEINTDVFYTTDSTNICLLYTSQLSVEAFADLVQKVGQMATIFDREM